MHMMSSFCMARADPSRIRAVRDRMRKIWEEEYESRVAGKTQELIDKGAVFF
jgi:hypothetical protein